MTDQEIEKLRDKLGSEYSVKRLNGAITVELADIWKGVEFAECVEYHKGSRTGAEIIKGHIYKITDWFKRELVYFDGFKYGWSVLFFKPSTEAAYVEQLKYKAKELYGEIKDGDRFKGEGFENKYVSFIGHDLGRGFIYQKCSDTLHLNHLLIYKQGKWAKKTEPIRLTIYADQTVDGKTQVGMTIKSEFPLNVKDRKEFLNHIEEAIESYLNKIT